MHISASFGYIPLQSHFKLISAILSNVFKFFVNKRNIKNVLAFVKFFSNLKTLLKQLVLLSKL